jgi:hypothetical protein
MKADAAGGTYAAAGIRTMPLYILFLTKKSVLTRISTKFMN